MTDILFNNIKIKHDKGNFSLILTLNRLLTEEEAIKIEENGHISAGIGFIIKKKINNNYTDLINIPVGFEKNKIDHIISENDFSLGDKIKFHNMFLENNSYKIILLNTSNKIYNFTQEQYIDSIEFSISVFNNIPSIIMKENFSQSTTPPPITYYNLQLLVNEYLNLTENEKNGFRYGRIGTWDVSRVTYMSYLFKDKTNFNEDISNWNVSKVKDMHSMFLRATSFNQDISNWDVSNVKDMHNMFREAESFNQDISNWDVSNVTDMSSMFEGATKFNQDISNWDVSNVSNMRSMFLKAKEFNQELAWTHKIIKINEDGKANMFTYSGGTIIDPPTTQAPITYDNLQFLVDEYLSLTEQDKDNFRYGRIGTWDVSRVIFMSFLFEDKINFNEDISNWDVSNVEYMNSMFEGATKFNQDISNWNVSKVVYMNKMFHRAESFNQDISNWDVSKVEDMKMMFQRAISFNQDISNWNVSKVKI